MGPRRRSFLGAGLMLIVLLATSFGLAPTLAASTERDSAPPTARIVEVHSNHGVLPHAGAVGSRSSERHVTRVLKFLTFAPVLVALAMAAALLTSSSARRHFGRALDPSILVASGVSRRGPPLVG